MQYLIVEGRRKKIIVFIFSFLFPVSLLAQLKWDGEAGDGKWNTAMNWVGDALPGGTADVVLDNSFVPGNYTVLLPGGSLSVSIRTIAIAPSAGNNIRLVLPVSNIAVPAFTATGPGYGVIINSGGSLVCSSGSPSGNVLVVNDSFRINNGGQYIHNSRAAHAAIVAILSRMQGTEAGMFKFDVPGGGYAVSVANRVYGTLVFSADASGGSQSYTSIAASPLRINADLIINAGVTVSFDITNSVFINRNYIQNGGVFNIASQPNNNITFIKGDLIQNAGVITETSTGLPVFELNGSAIQNITVSGSIINSIGFKINNPAGVKLLTNLSLPYHLNLANGIVNGNSFLLSLLTGCTINADSAANNSFINGPLRKEGLSANNHFLFPVGKGITQRWVALKNVTGNYTVEFFKSDPRDPGNAMGPGVQHISSIEYWTIDADASPAPVANVELSFDNVNSGGVTDLTKLLVAQLFGSAWLNEGNTATTGNAGMAGSVTSNTLTVFGPSNKYFTLAGSDAFQNPLPARLLSFTGRRLGDEISLSWETAAAWLPAYFELQSSVTGNDYSKLATIDAVVNQTRYRYADKRKLSGVQFYRLKIRGKEGSVFFSNEIAVMPAAGSVDNIKLIPSAVTANADLVINSGEATSLQIKIHDMPGRMLALMHVSVVPGSNIFSLQLQQLASGFYWITIIDKKNKTTNIGFVKLN